MYRMNKPNMTHVFVVKMMQDAMESQMCEHQIDAKVKFCDETDTFTIEVKTSAELAEILVLMSRLHRLAPEFTGETETGFIARYSYVEPQ